MNIDISELCRYLEAVATHPSNTNKVKVTYFNGKKEASYHAPKFVTTKMVLSGEADKITLAWYAEIFVDGRCIFRESWMPSDEDWGTAEIKANDKLMKSIFCHGIMSSKREIEERSNR